MIQVKAPNEHSPPIAQVRLNGIFVPTWRVEVEKTAYSVADTATCDTFIADSKTDWSALSAKVVPCPFEVFMGESSGLSGRPNPGLRVLYGLLDELDYTYEEDMLEMRARGVLALLIDQRITARLPMNSTVDKVIASLITQYGLTAQVATTDVKAGKFLEQDYVGLGRNVRVFDLIVAMADQLGWTVRVQDTTVVVGPPFKRGTVPELAKVWGSNAGEKLKVTHSALHSRNIKVIVHSYSPGKKARVLSSSSTPSASESIGMPTQAPASAPSIGPPVGRQTGFTSVGQGYAGEIYSFHIPGLTQDQCDRMASGIRDELTRKEYVAEMEFAPSPSELQTLVQAGTDFTVHLTGCSQASHNQVYHPRKVAYRYELGDQDGGSPGGLTVNMLLVNHDVPSPSGGI